MAVTKAYKAYLKSPAWERKRQMAFNYYGKKCFACGTRRGAIQVHHLTYARLGREALGDLRPLCASCHREVSALHWKMGKRTSGIVVFSRFMKIKSAQRSQYRKK